MTMYHDEYEPYATEADAHREWHRNTGIPMGTPGCPQDACHDEPDDWDEEDLHESLMEWEPNPEVVRLANLRTVFDQEEPF